MQEKTRLAENPLPQSTATGSSGVSAQTQLPRGAAAPAPQPQPLPAPPPASAPVPNLQHRLDALPSTDAWAVHAAEFLLAEAERLACSDLHISCSRAAVRIRARREGALFPLAQLPAARRDLLIARLKVLARLPSFKKHEPQDGRIERPALQPAPGSLPDTAKISADTTPAIAAATPPEPRLLRASFLPTLHGENVVIRFPETGSVPFLLLHQLGITPPMQAAMETLLHRREGAVILTGPSSSGKTTTLYAMLEWLNRRHGDRLNILTIEDPAERDLPFAGQVQVNPAQRLTFDAALRSALRQDPNVLMLGEVRDAETARVAMQAGMSGHLVLTTLHAGRAGRVFSRLLSMGVEHYLVASAVAGAAAQRLVRRQCAACAGEGCPRCGDTGTAGRTAIFECCVVTEALRELILAKTAPSRVAAEAARQQTGDLLAEGMALVNAGVISRTELDFALAGEETGDA